MPACVQLAFPTLFTLGSPFREIATIKVSLSTPTSGIKIILQAQNPVSPAMLHCAKLTVNTNHHTF